MIDVGKGMIVLLKNEVTADEKLVEKGILLVKVYGVLNSACDNKTF